MRIKGEWKLTKVLLNDEDWTERYNDSLINDNYTSMKLEINKDGGLSEYIGSIQSERYPRFLTEVTLSKKEIFFSEWRFNPDSHESIDTLNLKCFNRLFGKARFQIQKLYNKNFMIKRSMNNVDYEIHFKKK